MRLLKSKGAVQTWWPDFDPWEVEREPTPHSCLSLASTLAQDTCCPYNNKYILVKKEITDLFTLALRIY